MDDERIKFADVDDTGTDTLRRYAYQAKVVFPFVLRCALKGEEIAVIPEHVEDCLVVRETTLAYLQIKTRDPSQGGWTLGDLLSSGGALRSLHTAYGLAPDLPCTYGVLLEQSLSRTNIATLLRTEEGRTNAKVVKQVAQSLSITPAKAKAFLAKVRIKEALPTRDSIDAVNLRLLQSVAPDWPYKKAVRVYDRALEEIWRAMQATPVGVDWPHYTDISSAGDEALKKRYDAKRIDFERCKPIFGDMTSGVTTLLTREVSASIASPSNLERKMLEGGATQEVIDHAKELRARAVVAEVERLTGVESASKPFTAEDPSLHAVQKKLEWHAGAANGKHAQAAAPANLIWSELLTELPKLASNIDPNGVFGQDGYLLLGELCELSDQCVTKWGGKNA
jgi:hypothetical protein